MKQQSSFKFLIALLTGLIAIIGAWAQPNFPDPPTFSVSLDKIEGRPGEALSGKAIVTFKEGFHGYQNPQTDKTIIPVELKAVEPHIFAKIVYPKGKEKIIPAISEKPYFLYSGTIEIPFQVVLDKEPGAQKITFQLSFQQCDDQNCYPPGQVESTVDVTVAGEPVVAGSTTPAEVQSLASPEAKPEGQSGLASFVRENLNSGNWLALIGVFFGIGLAINLTPCVYPLVPVTLSFFSNQAKSGVGGRLALGFAYMLGIAITYGLIGGLAAAAGGAFGVIFAHPAFNIAMGLLMIGLALSMFDLYQIGLPPFISKHLRGRSGVIGALIMGLLLGFGAAPCAGPVIVTLFTVIAELGRRDIGIIAFTLVGVGLGFPYMILGAVSSGAKALPKAGSWMKAVKAMMGIAVLYFGLEYILRGVPGLTADQNRMAWMGFFTASAAVLLWLGKKETDSRFHVVNGVGVLLCGLMLGQHLSRGSGAAVSELEFEKFTVAAWDEAKTQNKFIMIDATANWCAECKVIEASVFSKPKAKELTENLRLMKIDWSTGVDQKYIDETRVLFGIKGLPHIIFAKPGGEIAKVVNSLHSVEELEEILVEIGAKE